jgi:hypothetical protein
MSVHFLQSCRKCVTCSRMAALQAGANGQDKSYSELRQECEWAKRLNAAAENPSADPHVMQEFQGYQLNQQVQEIQAELEEIHSCQKSGRC